MTPDWTPLDRELELWRRDGLTLPLWWRDDDAVEMTPKLDTLNDLSERLGLPVHLAVIPRDTHPHLARDLPESMIPVVHGWAHRNHAPEGEKKAEFGAHRPLADILKEAQAGLARLHELFGTRLCPIFVPPWNRIGREIIPGLGSLGYRALSTFAPRKAPEAGPGLAQVNTHLDPIDWRGSRGLADTDRLIGQLVTQLRDRRTGQADNEEPYGLLTHHLVHDQQIWDFTEAALTRLVNGPARPWALDTPDSSPRTARDSERKGQ